MINKVMFKSISGPCTIPARPRDGRWSYSGYVPGKSVPHNTGLLLTCNSRFTKRQSRLECNDGEWSDSDDVRRLCEGSKLSSSNP